MYFYKYLNYSIQLNVWCQAIYMVQSILNCLTPKNE